MDQPIPAMVLEGKLQSYSAGCMRAQEMPAVCESDCSYIPRQPEKSVLYEAVAGYLEMFLAQKKESGRLVPRFVEREMRRFLECGIAARGFLRVHCDACGKDRIVPYSCKCRGFCPSCCGRRMAETAAHLVDHVFPEVPVRQWVLSVPWAHVRNLASRLLALAAKRIATDWRRLYAYQPLLLESFVDSERYAGACYRAANWILVGYTKGRGKLDREFKAHLSRKAVLLYPLTKDATRHLRG